MSITTMIDSLPIQMNRRGAIVAVEGCKGAGKSFLIDKIKEQLGIEDEDIIQDIAYLPDYGPEYSNFDILVRLAHIHEMVDGIIKSVTAGRTVIIEGYVMYWLAKAFVSNSFKCRTMSRNKALGMLSGFLKDLPIPDIIFCIQPSTEIIVARHIKAKRLELEDDYVFHDLKEEAQAFAALANNGFLENVCILQGDSITKETEAVNMITCTAAIQMNKNPIRFY